jgi:hypothetical protein
MGTETDQPVKEWAWRITIPLAFAAAALVGGFLAGTSLDDDPKPSDSPAETYVPEQPSHQDRLIECVEEHQALYGGDINLSRGICLNYLNDQGVTP